MIATDEPKVSPWPPKIEIKNSLDKYDTNVYIWRPFKQQT
jgi:hypothetical protein